MMLELEKLAEGLLLRSFGSFLSIYFGRKLLDRLSISIYI
jgi:hypothetical protein